MKVTIIHGQSHKGITYTMTHTVLKYMISSEDEYKEFFLPKDGPDFCIGCKQCFMKGEEHCPSAQKMLPIAQALEWADVVILDSPNYVMNMSGGMKNLMDHLAYRWVVHRPHGSMFHKVGVSISSSAGAPAMSVVKSMAKQLEWMCCPKVYLFPLTSYAMTASDMKPKKKEEMEKKAKKIARAVKKRVMHPHTSFRSKIQFMIFRKMQSSSDAAWNPTDRDWWVNQGWTKVIRPWK